MEGQTNQNGSFCGAFGAQQGPPNSYVDRLASLGNRLSPAESRSSQHMLAPHDGSIGHMSTPCNRVLTSRGWDHGESSSTGNNVQEKILDDDSKMRLAWYSFSGTSSVADISPEDGPPVPSSAINPGYVGNQVTDTSHLLTFRPNHRHLRENSNSPSGLVGGRPRILYESGRVGAEETLVCYDSSSNLDSSSFISSPSIENNDAPAPSLGTWGSSCKRKALEGSSRHFHPGGCSNSNQPKESVVQHPVPGRGTASRNLITSTSSFNTDRLEQLNSSRGVGTGSVCSGRFTSSSVQGITQSPVRNFASRSRPRLGEPIPFHAPRGPSVGHSTLNASQTQSEHISNLNALELMSPMALPLNLNNALNEPFVNVNESGHTHHHPWNESLSSRHGSLSGSLLLPRERGYRAREEENLRSSVSNMPEYLAIGPASDAINIFRNHIDGSFTPGTSASSRSYSGGQLPSATRLAHGNQTLQNPQRSIESAHRIPFPSIESVSGNQRSLVAPLPQASASSGERARLSQARHQSDRRQSSFLRDARGGTTNGRNVLAAVEGRHRLIRQVLHMSSMRRGVSLGDEELLALQEQIGNVSTGLSEKKIRDSLKKRKHGVVKASQVMEPCCICQEDYVAGDDIGILDCQHEFHTSCIKQWLILKNICPICKNTALGT
ncbi:E3 ubiquitin-protein ligase MBR1-like isoform X2 [Salvia hispanica]|uniref:E3 ubiquitin-protein ligase MBR1-like isoform X2 n=1 Tax=Salvia hispanica TaxID=49212 RepID=UPI0020090E16|nr:E3 ubiquitin-protein ligase MBR1-like isoform X2 [Salvia hispanica]